MKANTYKSFGEKLRKEGYTEKEIEGFIKQAVLEPNLKSFEKFISGGYKNSKAQPDNRVSSNKEELFNNLLA